MGGFLILLPKPVFYRVFFVIVSFAALVFPIQNASGDAPSEKFYFDRSDVDEKILEHAIGVFTVRIPDLEFFTSFYDGIIRYRGREFPTADFNYQILTFESKNGSFIPAAAIPYSSMRPVSGWRFGGIEAMRFPLLNKKAGYLEIVCDPVRNVKAWIDAKELSEDIKATHHPDFHAYETCFNAGGKTDLCVDIFRFTEASRRKLFAAPDVKSKFTVIDPMSPIAGKDEGVNFGAVGAALYITEIKKGFGRLCGKIDWDPVTNRNVMRKIGWIRIRDSQNRLTIWPIIPLN